MTNNFVNVFKRHTSKKSSQVLEFITPTEMINHIVGGGIIEVDKKTNAQLYLFGELIGENVRRGRSKSDFKSTNTVVLDIDEANGKTLETIAAKLDGYAFIAHETFSSTEENKRYRFIVPVSETLSYEDVFDGKIASRLAEFLGVSTIDVCSNNPVQIYYVPSSPVGIKRDLIANATDNTLSISQLPELVSFKSNKLSSSIAFADPRKRKIAELEDEARNLRDNEFEGIFYAENQFWLSEKSFWKAYTAELFTKYLLVVHYKEEKLISDVCGIVNALKVLTVLEKFPEPEGNHALALNNVVIEPATGQVIPYTPELYIRNKLNFDYDAAATCEKWLKFLDEIFVNDEDRNQKIQLLKEYMGYSLTPSTRFQKMMWLVGNGSNGKSVILNIMSALVGEHNTSAVPLKDFSKTFSLIGMKDKLINIDADFPIDGAIADDKMKIIVSGDLIKVEEKREKAFYSKITAKMWAAMNNLPKTKDNSHGFFRRVAMLTFNRKFEDHEQDKSLEKVLMTELPGIFNWALEGLHELLENDQFTVPASSKTELEEYKILSNPVAKFVQEHIKLVDTKGSPKQGLLISDVYSSFTLFSHANGFARMSSSTFGVRMKALGIVSSKSNGKSYYPVKLHDAEGYSSSYTNVPTGTSIVDVEDVF